MYLHVQLKLHDLGVSLPRKDGFSKVKNTYIKRDYYSVCDEYGVNQDETRCMGTGFIRRIMVFLIMT